MGRMGTASLFKWERELNRLVNCSEIFWVQMKGLVPIFMHVLYTYRILECFELIVQINSILTLICQMYAVISLFFFSIWT